MNYKQAISSLGLSCFLAGIATAQAKLENVKVEKTNSGVKLTFTGTSLTNPKLTTAYKGKVVFVDFKAHISGKAKTSQVNSGGIKYFRYGWHGRPPYARVAVYLSNPSLKPWVAPAGNGTWSLNFGPKAATLNTSAYNDVYSEGKFDLLPPIQSAEYIPPAETKAHTGPTSLKDAIIASGIAPVNTKTYKEPIVSLDFSNAEITLILRGLADQSGVNIVTSPDVSGRISVNLESVTLTEALNLVTTIGNVRYTKIGKTYLVTSTARFSDAIRQVIGKLDEAGETRVIQLRSGEGKQIKAATLKALPQLATDGYYDLILPTEKISAKTTSGTGTTQVNSGNAGTGSGSGPQTGGGTGPQTSGAGGSGGQGTGVSASMSETQGSSVSLSSETEGSTGKDMYLVVVANTERIGSVVSFIEGLDRKIAEANSLAGSTAIETRAIALYSPNDTVVLEAVKNMASRDPRASSFNISVSSAGIVGQLNAMKLLVISGPASGVDDLAYVARTTDRSIARALGIAIPSEGAEALRSFAVLDLNFVEPAYAMNQLTLHVRGLAVSMMPPPVDPGATGKVETNVKDSGQSSGGATTSANGGGQLGSPGVTKEGEDSESKAEVRGTEPMRLLVYGTDEQVSAARSLLGVIDIEPKVVALELRVLELSKEDALQAGINWNIFSNGDIGFIRVNQALGSAGQAGGIGVTPPAGRRNGHTITGVLDAITTKNNLISRPNTLAMDGRPTYLFVGDTVRYVESIQSTQQGVTVTSGKVDVGVTLAVTPRVGADGTLTIRMAPNLTILRGFTDVPGGGQLPQTSERRADTTFTMNDGDTIAIGGLITDQDRKAFGGIPIIRDIPILGRLFGRTDNTRIRSEVVFFVTAKVVDKSKLKDTADPRNSEKKNPVDPSKEKIVPKIGINP